MQRRLSVFFFAVCCPCVFLAQVGFKSLHVGAVPTAALRVPHIYLVCVCLLIPGSLIISQDITGIELGRDSAASSFNCVYKSMSRALQTILKLAACWK